MNFEKNNKPDANNELNNALVEIEHIRGMIYGMGANDSEMSELDGIVAQLKKRKLSGKEAVAKARGILDRKYSDH